jgi:hypothetical protein
MKFTKVTLRLLENAAFGALSCTAPADVSAKAASGPIAQGRAVEILLLKLVLSLRLTSENASS